jgi:hypothetical protein
MESLPRNLLEKELPSPSIMSPYNAFIDLIKPTFSYTELAYEKTNETALITGHFLR